jgi:biopolymer transport protein TolQ
MPQFNLVNIGSNFQGNIAEMVLHSGGVAKFVLLILLLFSIASWTIIAQKYRIFSRAKKETARFLQTFYENSNLTVVYTESKELDHSPVAKVFTAGYEEIREQQKIQKPLTSLNDSDLFNHRTERIRSLDRVLSKTVAEETANLEKAMIFLATTGSSTPFIGLFGTVWGVMNAFRGIGMKGSSSIGVVAPGISEALIATAAGLVVAIPAVIFYNYFVNRVRVLSSEMDNFSAELINLVEKDIIRA